MRHQNAGSFGAPTNRLVTSRVIADCYVLNGVVTEEWLVRDQAAFARRLGVEPRVLAQQLTIQDLSLFGSVGFFLPEHDRPGRNVPRIEDAPEIAVYMEGYRRLWEVKDTSAVRDLYFHGAEMAISGGETRHGHMDIDRFYFGYLASFPDGEFSVQSATINRDAGQPVRVAEMFDDPTRLKDRCRPAPASTQRGCILTHRCLPLDRATTLRTLIAHSNALSG